MSDFWTRLMALLTDQVLMVGGLMVLGIAFAYALTNFIKPWLKAGERRKPVIQLRIRAMAFVVATNVTFLLLRAMTGLDSATEAICAVLAGLLTPLAFDLINDWLPRLRPTRRPE